MAVCNELKNNLYSFVKSEDGLYKNKSKIHKNLIKFICLLLIEAKYQIVRFGKWQKDVKTILDTI